MSGFPGFLDGPVTVTVPPAATPSEASVPAETSAVAARPVALR